MSGNVQRQQGSASPLRPGRNLTKDDDIEVVRCDCPCSKPLIYVFMGTLFFVNMWVSYVAITGNIWESKHKGDDAGLHTEVVGVKKIETSRRERPDIFLLTLIGLSALSVLMHIILAAFAYAKHFGEVHFDQKNKDAPAWRKILALIFISLSILGVYLPAYNLFQNMCEPDGMGQCYVPSLIEDYRQPPQEFTRVFLRGLLYATGLSTFISLDLLPIKAMPELDRLYNQATCHFASKVGCVPQSVGGTYEIIA